MTVSGGRDAVLPPFGVGLSIMKLSTVESVTRFPLISSIRTTPKSEDVSSSARFPETEIFDRPLDRHGSEELLSRHERPQRPGRRVRPSDSLVARLRVCRQGDLDFAQRIREALPARLQVGLLAGPEVKERRGVLARSLECRQEPTLAQREEILGDALRPFDWTQALDVDANLTFPADGAKGDAVRVGEVEREGGRIAAEVWLSLRTVVEPKVPRLGSEVGGDDLAQSTASGPEALAVTSLQETPCAPFLLRVEVRRELLQSLRLKIERNAPEVHLTRLETERFEGSGGALPGRRLGEHLERSVSRAALPCNLELSSTERELS